MALRADLYWSFRSPYSWLAIGRYRAMTEAYDLEIALKPVYPLAIRQPPSCTYRWWIRQSSIVFFSDVSPPSAQCTM